MMGICKIEEDGVRWMRSHFIERFTPIARGRHVIPARREREAQHPPDTGVIVHYKNQCHLLLQSELRVRDSEPGCGTDPGEGV